MQVIQEIQINNHKVSLFNTVEEPLFEAKQVIETVLEYTVLNECRFYKDNKKNEKFVQIQASGRLPVGQNQAESLCGNLTHGDWGTNQYSNETIYLTEFGLYECLFASKKPTAQQFRLQVMTLLRDLRIGNLRLSVQKECETTKLLQANKESLLAEIVKRSELEKQVLYLQARLEKASEEVAVYEIEIDGKIYRGTALQLIRRLKQHLMNSCNPSVRQLINSKKTTRSFSTGAEVKMRLLHTQRVSNRDERNYIESEFIKRIPSTQRLNRNMPRVRDFSNVSEECKSELSRTINNPIVEEVKVQINNRRPQVQQQQQEDDLITIGELNQSIEEGDLTTIGEVDQSIEEGNLRDKLLKIKEFIRENNGIYPLQRGVTPEERSLASTVQYLRRGRKGTIHRNGKLVAINENTIKMVDQVIPGFIWANHRSKYEITQGVQLVKQKAPRNVEYSRITDQEFKDELQQFITRNPRKLRDLGAGEAETKFYKKIKNLVVRKTEQELKDYFGSTLFQNLKTLNIV